MVETASFMVSVEDRDMQDREWGLFTFTVNSQ